MRQAVEIVRTKTGEPICACHGWSTRWLIRNTGERVNVHCEHPDNYIEYGEGYIPDYCERCGWNLGRYDRRGT